MPETPEGGEAKRTKRPLRSFGLQGVQILIHSWGRESKEINNKNRVKRIKLKCRGT